LRRSGKAPTEKKNKGYWVGVERNRSRGRVRKKKSLTNVSRRKEVLKLREPQNIKKPNRPGKIEEE